jgi:cell division protein FtsB
MSQDPWPAQSIIEGLQAEVARLRAENARLLEKILDLENDLQQACLTARQSS